MLRPSIIALLAALAVSACEPVNQGYAPAQPILYSHAVHAGAYEVPCQYCHYAAERGPYAGIPPAQLCMNCHSQVVPDNPEIQKLVQALETGQPIAWTKVHWLPDHAYFNHSVHVNADVSCQTCHGPVEEMGRVEQWAPLTMGWCINCHRDNAPADVLAQPGALRASNQLTDCATCHH